MDGRGVGARIASVVLVVVAALGVAGIAAVALLMWILSRPPSVSDAGKDAIGEQARSVAYALRNSEVRAALDRGATPDEVGTIIGAVPATRSRIAEIGSEQPSASGLVLLRSEKVGDTGVAVQVVEGGVVGPVSWWDSSTRPWVTCLRIELPVTEKAATEWSVADATCPTFRAGVRGDAQRVHASELPADPLLRPPCYGTTGYCPGG